MPIVPSAEEWKRNGNFHSMMVNEASLIFTKYSSHVSLSWVFGRMLRMSLHISHCRYFRVLGFSIQDVHSSTDDELWISV